MPGRPTVVVKPSMVRAVQGSLETRRGTVENARAAVGGTFQVYGRAELAGAGEATFETNFPVWFTEVPQVSFGGELTGNQALAAGNYPRVNVMVRSWRTNVRAQATLYTGAEFVVVVDGPATMTSIAHWQCEGTALVNPVIPDEAL